jgi:hypothetical protein
MDYAQIARWSARGIVLVPVVLVLVAISAIRLPLNQLALGYGRPAWPGWRRLWLG